MGIADSRCPRSGLAHPQGTLAIVDNHAWLMEGTEDGITLAIKPNGITCTLSKFLPQYIAKNIAFFADGFLKKHNLGRDDGECWIISRRVNANNRVQ